MRWVIVSLQISVSFTQDCKVQDFLSSHIGGGEGKAGPKTGGGGSATPPSPKNYLIKTA